MVNGGYNCRLSSENISFFSFYDYTQSANSYTSDQINVSLGRGVSFGGAWGYMFSEKAGIELAVSCLRGSKYKAKDEYPGGHSEYELSSRMLRIMPSLVLSVGAEKFNPYMKFGFVIGRGSFLFHYEDYGNGNQFKVTQKFSGGTPFGINAAIGAIFKSKAMVAYYAEINSCNLSYSPKKGEVTEYIINGTDRLYTLSVNDKELEFVDSYTYNANVQDSESEPSRTMSQKFPFGSIGLTVGLRINLHKGNVKKESTIKG
jgi:hypothetical protein